MPTLAYLRPDSAFSPVDYKAPVQGAPAMSQPLAEALSPWPTFDVDTIRTEHELSPAVAKKVHDLAVLSLSDSVEGIKEFGRSYKDYALTPEQAQTFQAHRNALLEERMQAGRQPQQPRVVSQVMPAVRTQESPAAYPEPSPLYSNPYLAELVPRSLSLRNSPAFQAHYNEFGPEGKFAFDTQVYRDWVRASRQFGAEALAVVGITKPANEWRAIPPYAETPPGRPVITQNHAFATRQTVRPQGRQGVTLQSAA